MTRYEEDYETSIVRKLDDMIDFVESFKSSLEESLEKKGGEVKVHAPAGGFITWERGIGLGEEVVRQQPLCTIKEKIDDLFNFDNRKVWEVTSPTAGTIIWLTTKTKVGAGERIVVIEPKHKPI